MSMSKGTEDMLYSLPDHILIDGILSRLKIDEAATTSVLSHKWRHLWTGINRVQFCDHYHCYDDSRQVFAFFANILPQLICPKLRVFDVLVESRAFGVDPSFLESCFRELGNRNIEHICVNCRLDECDYDDLFQAPVSLFKIKSLETLRLDWLVKLPDDVPPTVNFPNLKTLHLDFVVNLPPWFGTLLSSCPKLEHLVLRFNLFIDNQHQPQSDMHIATPNLKTLHINIINTQEQASRAKILIDAPGLTKLEIHDFCSCYDFVRKPTQLIKAVVKGGGSCEVSRFIARMCSARKLRFELDSECHKNIYYPYLISYVDRRPLTTFPNLHCLKTTWHQVRLSEGWTDLLFTMQCFPNLERLKVVTESCNGPSLKLSNWYAPKCVPSCLANKLKKITIKMGNLTVVDGFDNALKLLAYILSNANVLEKLLVSVSYVHGENVIDRASYARVFYRSLKKIPRNNLACKIEFSYEDCRMTEYYTSEELLEN